MADKYHYSAADLAALPGTKSVHPFNPAARRTIRSPGDAAGLTGLGIHIFEVAPGDKSTEFHVHACEDEAVFVLDGTGTARTGDAEHTVGPGDFIGYPKGGPAHEITATGDAPLRLLVIGQRLSEDVVDYPDLGKRLFRAAGQPGALVDVERITTLPSPD